MPVVYRDKKKRGIGAPKKITKAQLKEAIKGSGGIHNVICRKLGIGVSTLKNKLKAHPELAHLISEEKQNIRDYAMSIVIDAIVNKKDLKTAKWYLGMESSRLHGETGAVTSDLEVSIKEVSLPRIPTAKEWIETFAGLSR